MCYCNSSAVNKVFDHAKTPLTDKQKYQCGHPIVRQISLKANLGFSTTASSQKLSASDDNIERQLEMAIWPPKPLIVIPLNYTQRRNSNGKSGVFDHAQREETDPGRLRQRPTTGNGNIDVLGANLAIFGSRSLDRCRNHLANLLSSLAEIWWWYAYIRPTSSYM